MKTMKTMITGLLLVVAGMSFAQSVTFRVQEIVVPPSQITSTKCVQLGIFMDYTGPSATWGHFEASLDYTLPSAAFVDGNPFVNVTDFDNPPKAGITSPGQVMTNDGGMTTPCAIGDIINSATLGGPNVNLMVGAGGVAAIVTESVVPAGATGSIDITSLSFGSLFTTNDGESYLMAIIEFPLAAGQGTGQVDVVFRNTGPADNFITDGVTTLAPTLDDGWIQVFDTIDCGDGTNFAVFDDVVGTGTASTLNGNASIGLDYLDPTFGGAGGEMDVAINFGNGVSAYQITGTDGFDTGQVMVVGPGSDSQTINPDTSGGNSYELTFFVLGLDGITLVPGTACTLTQSWNPASCNATWTNNGIGGANSVFTVSLTNAFPSAGVFASVDVPAGATGIADFDITDATGQTGTSGGTVTLEVVDQAIPDGTWAGDWFVTNLSAPGGADRSGGNSGNEEGGKGEGVFQGGASCSDVLGFTCPTNNATANVATIGSTITINLIGSDELSWDVSYNGVTTTGISPDDATFVTPNNAVASATTITVVANGVGPDGLPCPDTQVITLDFVAPACTSATQNPDSTVTPVDVGTVITLTLVTSGAISAEIDNVAMTLASGTPGVTNSVTWEATHVAVADTTVTATITNPDGETTTCSWNIEINCIDPTIASVGPVGGNGITIAGTPDCVYTIRITSHIDGTVDLYDVTVGPDGNGVLNIVIPPDVWIEVGQQGIPVVTDSTFTVPTLGQWGLFAFVTLLLATGVFFMRRKRLV
jgi:hypothetical protein